MPLLGKVPAPKSLTTDHVKMSGMRVTKRKATDGEPAQSSKVRNIPVLSKNKKSKPNTGRQLNYSAAGHCVTKVLLTINRSPGTPILLRVAIKWGTRKK